MEINLPALSEQQRMIYESSTREAIATLEANLNAPVLHSDLDINEADYCNKHLLRKSEGWQAPHNDVVGAYFRQFQALFAEYGSDKALAALLGVSSDRRVREYKQGRSKIPYDIWRRFLVITGRAPQEVISVKGFVLSK